MHHAEHPARPVIPGWTNEYSHSQAVLQSPFWNAERQVRLPFCIFLKPSLQASHILYPAGLFPQDQCMRMHLSDLLKLFQKISVYQRAIGDHNRVLITFTHRYNRLRPAASRPSPYPDTWMKRNDHR